MWGCGNAANLVADNLDKVEGWPGLTTTICAAIGELAAIIGGGQEDIPCPPNPQPRDGEERAVAARVL